MSKARELADIIETGTNVVATSFTGDGTGLVNVPNTFKGTYSLIESYKPGDVVFFNNSYYISNTNNVGIEPTDLSVWFNLRTLPLNNTESLAQAQAIALSI